MCFQKCIEKIGRPTILHDNARPHKHLLVKEFLQEHGWEKLDHSSYSHDMSPRDMHDIARIKGPNKGKQFQTQDELINDYEGIIRDINRNQESLGITMSPDRWRAVAIVSGKYI